MGQFGTILKTTNGGTDWIEQSIKTTNYLASVYFTDSNTGWIVGTNGTILHTTNGGVTFIEEEGNNPTQPKEFLLQQNYPNPFNPSTSIQYEINSMQFVTIKVYDLLGREVVTLVNEEKPTGKYEVNFNASNLTSGVYFYRIQAGDFVETKKMIYLK